MKFTDEVEITVEAGKGGDGCCSFLRAKFIPLGGPDGGDGGSGGNVFLVADRGLNTLGVFRHKRSYKAENGENGRGKQCSGKDGQDLFIKVPLGTMVYNKLTEELICDLIKDGQSICIAHGGKKGVGNLTFKNSTNRSPRQFTEGVHGEKREIRLELQVLADVGLLGLPNAGKSTFIRAISDARPKIADYPFTTLYPHLGVVYVDETNSFMVADIPGLIEGASDGKGLGIQFLKHLLRTKMLLHIVDVSEPNSIDDIIAGISIIEKELGAFNKALLKKERWIVFNKIDLVSDENKLDKLCKILQKSKSLAKNFATDSIFRVSSIKKIGMKNLCFKIVKRLKTV